MTFGSDLTLALELADVADAMTMARFRAPDLRVRTKPDLTPVTEVDHAVEDELRRRLAVARPGQAVLGEETPDLGCRAGAAQRWIIDPIDGTKNYVRGVPVWATLIALERDGTMVVGVVAAPALGRRWWAAKGEGAWAGDSRPTRASRSASPRSATSTTPSSATTGWSASTPMPSTATPTAAWCGWPTGAGGAGAWATSGPTCWWPRALSTSPPSRSSRCGTWPRSR